MSVEWTKLQYPYDDNEILARRNRCVEESLGLKMSWCGEASGNREAANGCSRSARIDSSCRCGYCLDHQTSLIAFGPAITSEQAAPYHPGR